MPLQPGGDQPATGKSFCLLNANALEPENKSLLELEFSQAFPFFFFLFSFLSFQLPFATMRGKEPPLGDREGTLLTQTKFNFCEVHN